MVIGVPVIVNVALRAAPVFAATLKLTMPSPTPDAGLTVRNAWLLTAVHAQLVPLTEMPMFDDPPAAEKVVVVVPVIIWHPPGAVDDEELSSPQATAASRSATEQVASVRRKR